MPVESSLGVVANPTINNDDTVTVLMKDGYWASLLWGQQRLPLVPATSTVTNVRDGDSVVLTGLSIPTNDQEKRQAFAGRGIQGKHRDVLVLTTRIVRRYEEGRLTPPPAAAPAP